MISARGYAAHQAKAPLAPFEFQRREIGPHDVLIEIEHCGVCHSDIHQAREEWGPAIFPMVPGHEIIGKAVKLGSAVSKVSAGSRVGVGCFVDSCRSCSNCRGGLEQYCDNLLSFTYNGTEQDKTTPTYGGYSTTVVVDENYVLRIPANLDPAAAAPLLCAGITTYSPLRHWKAQKGQRVAVLGLGGLGHMAVKFAASFGCEVTVLSTSEKKEADAKRLGSHHFVDTSKKGALNSIQNSFDLVLDAVSAPHDLNSYLSTLRREGTLILVGVPPEAIPISAFSLLTKRRSLSGSIIGGIAETQEMLDYCGKENIVCDIEKIAMKDINVAYERMIKGDVRYRFVIDIATL